MKKLICFSWLILVLAGCTSLQDIPDDPQFQELTQKFLDEFMEVHPQVASDMGLSKYDSVLEIPNEKDREAKLAFYEKHLKAFSEMSEDDLSISQRMDRVLLINEMAKQKWYLQEFQEWKWNPSVYNIGNMVGSVVSKESRSVDERFKDLGEKLLKVNEYFQEVKNNIERPTKEHTLLAIKQSKGVVSYLDGEVKKKLKEATLDKKDKAAVSQRLSAASTAVKRYVTFLKGILAKPKTVGGFRDFRIGKEAYAKKFDLDLQIESTPLELYRKALSTKEDLRSKMFEAAIALYPKYYGEKLPPKDRQTVIRQILKNVSKKHGKAEDFVATVTKQIPELRKFIMEKDLIPLDPSRPLKVRETPLYQRGFAGASVDSPGPFDKKRETFYNVTPLDGMSKKQQESYLREYNDYTLQILNIHEAIPGHYAQLVQSNKSQSPIKTMFGSTSMIEGWAVYSERMMMEQGYGDGNQELMLMYYKWFLRTVTNTILDYEIHNKNIGKKEAMKLMVEDAFQEKTEAEGKWVRATVSQVQLASYFAGYSEIYALRELIKEKQEDEFSLKKFHETFLSFGSAPTKEIKKILLEML